MIKLNFPGITLNIHLPIIYRFTCLSKQHFFSVSVYLKMDMYSVLTYSLVYNTNEPSTPPTIPTTMVDWKLGIKWVTRWS
jgi:hypothetical protein